MATIGTVTRQDDGRYAGELRTVSLRVDIEIVPIADKASANLPDYRVLADDLDIGAGWIRQGQASGKEYVSLSLAVPELRPRIVYANLRRPAGQSDPDVFALIWNPQE